MCVHTSVQASVCVSVGMSGCGYRLEEDVRCPALSVSTICP